MERLLKNPIFWIGVIFGLIFERIIQSFLKDRNDSAELNRIHQSISITENLLGMVKKGENIDFERAFKCENHKRKNRTPTGYLAWEGFSLWLAHAYTKGLYIGQNVDDFWAMVGTCFPEDSGAYIKMRAFDEIINRSTYY